MQSRQRAIYLSLAGASILLNGTVGLGRSCEYSSKARSFESQDKS